MYYLQGKQYVKGTIVQLYLLHHTSVYDEVATENRTHSKQFRMAFSV